MIDGCKTHNLFIGVEVQSPHVIERCSMRALKINATDICFGKTEEQVPQKSVSELSTDSLSTAYQQSINCLPIDKVKCTDV